jgi:DNA-binding MurR/RpiR family transcriptional regulator
MNANTPHPLIQRIDQLPDKLTPKGRLLASYLIDNTRKAVFMTAKELAAACEISEATVIRFVAQVGYDGYSQMQQALRDYVDTELTLLDRRELIGQKGNGAQGFHIAVTQEIENLTHLYNTMDLDNLEQAVQMLYENQHLYIIGSRLSYTLAYYMWWALTKVKPNIRILRGSDSTTFDWLTIAPQGSLAVVIATSRYPNELIKVGRWARRRNMDLMVITDGRNCPVIPFAHVALVVPALHLPFLGTLTNLSCLIKYLVHEVANRRGDDLKPHQENIEQTYLENDLLFNPTH